MTDVVGAHRLDSVTQVCGMLPPEESELLSPAELEAMDLTAALWTVLNEIAADGVARYGDLTELAAHVHAIQHAVLAQAAGRAYPARFRLMGGDPLVEQPDGTPR